jgi:4-amino-4-deoxy-L-arabinose transferase-like glycosyltransferase
VPLAVPPPASSQLAPPPDSPTRDVISPPPLSVGEGLGLAVILLVAAWLRVWHVGASLPYAVGVDEPEIMERVVRMMKTGNFNPRFFDWPSLTMYVHLVTASVAFLAGAMRGAWNSLTQVGAADFYIYSRTVTAAFGTASVGALFFAARRWGTGTAVLAAAIFAVVPHHVRESHFVLADVPTTFFVVVALVTALRAYERPTLAAFSIAGLVVGLAASCKYNGSISVVMPVIAALAAGGGWRSIAQRIGVVGAALIVGFLAGTPYAVLDLPKFLSDYARLAAVFAHPRGGEPGWSLYLKYLRQSLGWVGFVFALVGLGASVDAAVRGPGRARPLILVAFALLYFKVMATSFQIYGRYTLPLLPIASMLVAVGAMALLRLVERRTSRRWTATTAALLAIGCVTPPLSSSIRLDRSLGRRGTIDLAYEFIDANVPAGAVIVSETHPMLLMSKKHRVRNIRPLIGSTYDEYRAAGVQYVLASSVGYDAVRRSPATYARERAAYDSIFALAHRLAVFEPSGDVPGPEFTLFCIQDPCPAVPAQ